MFYNFQWYLNTYILIDLQQYVCVVTVAKKAGPLKAEWIKKQCP